MRLSDPGCRPNHACCEGRSACEVATRRVETISSSARPRNDERNDGRYFTWARPCPFRIEMERRLDVEGVQPDEQEQLMALLRKLVQGHQELA